MSVICVGFRGGDLVVHSYGGLPEKAEIFLLESSGCCRVLIVFHIVRFGSFTVDTCKLTNRRRSLGEIEL